MPDRFYIGIIYHNTYIARFFHHQKMLDIPPTPVSASDLLPCWENYAVKVSMSNFSDPDHECARQTQRTDNLLSTVEDFYIP
jgi:hypothetical protein